MAESPVMMNTNGPINTDDTFEQDLKDMLKDAPSLNDMSSTVQGGAGRSEGGKPQAYIRPDIDQNRPVNTATAVPRPTSAVPPATSNIPLSSPERNGQTDPTKPAGLVIPSQSKLDTIRAWSINTYKCTRQMISERLGKGSKTVDLELESQIEALRDTQRKYANILRLARALTSHFYHVVQTQRQLGDSFADLSQKSPELQEEFSYNAETQRALCKNGEALLSALNFFTSSVNTLCNKTMEDTLCTIKQYEAARVEYDAHRIDLEKTRFDSGSSSSTNSSLHKVEYDAYRTDLDALQLGPRDSTTMPRMDDAQSKYNAHKEKYERLKADVAIKLKFLDENRVKVMHKQLLLFHNAVATYFSGNQTALEATLKQFNIRLKSPNSETPSWLEQ